MDAREQLHAARDLLEEMGMAALAERPPARAAGTGETIRKLAPPARRHRWPLRRSGHPDSHAHPLATCTVPLVDATPALPARR